MGRRKPSKKDVRERTAVLKAACALHKLDTRGACSSLEKRLRIHLQSVDDAQAAFIARAEANVSLTPPSLCVEAVERKLRWTEGSV